MTITVYSFEDADGEVGSFTTLDAVKARDRALQHHLRVIANDYEWSDSEVVWDYTGSAA